MRATAKAALFRRAIRWLPRVPRGVVWRAAWLGGLAWWALAGGTRRRVRAALAHIPALAASPERLARATRAAFGHLALNYVDLFCPPAPGEDVAATFPVAGAEHLAAALAAGRGAILYTIHSDGFERAQYRLRGLLPNRRVVVPAEAVQPPELFALVNAQRARSGLEFLPVTSGTTLREMIVALRAGGAVILPVDRDVPGTGITMPLFGAPTQVPTGVAALARLTGAPAVGIFPWREGGQRWRGVILPAEHLPPARGETATAAALAGILQTAAEQIAARPAQWLAVFAGDVWAPASGKRATAPTPVGVGGVADGG